MLRLKEEAYGLLAQHKHVKSLSQFALINAVVEKKQKGIIYLSDTDARVAFVKNKFGFSQISLANGASFDAAEFIAFLQSEEGLAGYYLMYAPPEALLNLVRRKPLLHQKIRERQQFKYTRHNPIQLESIIGDLPERFSLVDLTTLEASQLEAFDLDIGSRFWNSWVQFKREGIGFGVMDTSRQEVASICYAACIAGNIAEIDVATLESYQGNGLASIAVAAFLEYCVKQGVTANWDCFSANEPSLRLARKFNFIHQQTYSLLSFSITQALSERSSAKEDKVVA